MSTSKKIRLQPSFSLFNPLSPVYNLFIIVLTIFSLFVVVFQLLPVLTPATRQALYYIDSLICFVFLYDFYFTLRHSSSRLDYFIKGGGWLDLLGSIPSLPVLRVARLARMLRIIRFMRDKSSAAAVWKDFNENRAQSTFLLTVFAAIISITICSILVLQVESRSDHPNIVTGEDAFWWAFVTVTTVGYGDRYPTTTTGRLFGMILMSIGVVIYGVLTSFLAHFFLTGSTEDEDVDEEEMETIVAGLRSEIDRLHAENTQTQEQLQNIIALLQENEERK